MHLEDVWRPWLFSGQNDPHQSVAGEEFPMSKTEPLQLDCMRWLGPATTNANSSQQERPVVLVPLEGTRTPPTWDLQESRLSAMQHSP